MKRTPWSAKGLLFENCSCQLVCAGHVHFSQTCDGDRCVGYWAMRFDEGSFGEVTLSGLKAVISFVCPPRMIDGNWTQLTLIDAAASEPQRTALEKILSGEAGGPWAALSRFVSKRLETRFVDILFQDHGRSKSLKIAGIAEGSIQAIKGRDRTETVTFENMFNQIHAASQVLALGETRYDDGQTAFANETTHALYSHFEWMGEELH